MKTSIILPIALTLFLFSCNKPGVEPNEPPAADSILNSVHIYNRPQHISGIDTFYWDNNKRLARFADYEFDSSFTPVQIDSTVYSFSFTGTDSLPTGYTELSTYDTVNIYYTRTHRLFYDTMGRVLIDTVVSEGVDGHRSVHYEYMSSGVAIRVFLYDALSPHQPYEAERDTLFISNNKIASVSRYGHSYDPSNTGDRSVSTFFYGSFKNPFYGLGAPNGLGALLYLELPVDVISPNLPVKEVESDPVSNSSYSTNYFWVANGNETVVSGHDDDGIEYSFHYGRKQ